IVPLIRYAAPNSTPGNPNPNHHSPGIILLISLALCAPLAVRNYLPLTAWSASAVAMLLFGGGVTSTGTILGGGVLVYVLCLYAVAVRCPQWVRTAAAIATLVGGVFAGGQGLTSPIRGAALPVVGGAIVRTRRGN